MIKRSSIVDLIRELNETDESEDLEAKEASGTTVGKSVYETICALSNEPQLGGGTILLGVTKEEALFPFYSATGVEAPDKMSSDIATACGSQFNQPIRVNITPQVVNGATLLKIDVPELPANQKPLYFKAASLPRGAYRRIGPTDIRCSDEDLTAFFQGKADAPFDKRIIPDARWDDIDPTAIANYRRARADANPEAEELNWSDEDMLYALGAIQRLDGKIQVTATGLLTFGKQASLRRFMPTQRVDYIRVPGTKWVPSPDATFDSLDMRGPIVSLIPRVLNTILDDLPRTLVVEDSLSGQRTETPVVPLRVIREAVVNALMHRSYEVYQPVQIIRYANRITIKNPGYSLKSQDRFSEPGSAIRNPTIAEILHETRFAETKGSGIRVMQEKMRQSGLAAPTFESDRDAQEFIATFLFHHFLDESDWNWLAQFKDLSLTEEQMKALIFVREVGAIDNSTYRAIAGLDTLSASRSLRSLVQSELLKDRGAGAKTHYVAGKEMEARTIMAAPAIHAKPHNMDGNIHDKGLELKDLPSDLRVKVRIAHMQRRLKPEMARHVILSLCAWRPLSLTQLAELMDRQPTHLGQKYVSTLVSEGLLAHTYPEMVQHPDQKYITVDPKKIPVMPKPKS
jgi:Predicted transcriptional regulator containing an HTH domain and an uncharacterized domain shared with the mammalian protein Schlafen